MVADERKSILVRVDAEVAAQLKALASVSGRSANDVAIAAFTTYLDFEMEDMDRGTRRVWGRLWRQFLTPTEQAAEAAPLSAEEAKRMVDEDRRLGKERKKTQADDD